MTRFFDGPAKGQTLMLKRAPVCLRVTQIDGKFDALDQLDDVPRPEEKLYAYKLVANPGRAFLDGPKCRGVYAIAEYQLMEPQPNDEVMRDLANWIVFTNAVGPGIVEALNKTQEAA